MSKKLRLFLIALSLFAAAFSCEPITDTVTGSDTCTVSEAGIDCPSSDTGGF